MSNLKYPPDMKPGDIATLKVPYKGYRRIELLERLHTPGWYASAKAVRRSRSMKTSSKRIKGTEQ